MDRCQAFALLPWQGTYDFYRDRTRLDGIYSSGFLKGWWNQSVLRNQHGNPATNCISIYTGERVTGPASHRLIAGFIGISSGAKTRTSRSA
ncbi:MAG: hypothetical protein A3G80_08490 [Betaproteobacteria bacterium RIFCSPLOWO2_12_FULL_62_13b]|nr:MAG: hypothetical protein A3G80_08490 [Betaproteobacteria bacterium RIFCSPLOWO2_12_FULL_62_13b]